MNDEQQASNPTQAIFTDGPSAAGLQASDPSQAIFTGAVLLLEDGSGSLLLETSGSLLLEIS